LTVPSRFRRVRLRSIPKGGPRMLMTIAIVLLVVAVVLFLVRLLTGRKVV
jgi:hypothetical protein